MSKKISRGKLIGLLFDLETKPAKVARALGVSRQYIHQLMKKYDIKLKKTQTIEFK